MCSSDCCRNLSTPYQPCDKTSIESTREQVNKKGERRALTLSGIMNLSGSTCVLYESEYFVFIAYNAIKEGR